MKLTKEDFDLHKCTEKESYMVICKQNPLSVIQQILENEKLRELVEQEIDSNDGRITSSSTFLQQILDRSKE